MLHYKVARFDYAHNNENENGEYYPLIIYTVFLGKTS